MAEKVYSVDINMKHAASVATNIEKQPAGAHYSSFIRALKESGLKLDKQQMQQLASVLEKALGKETNKTLQKSSAKVESIAREIARLIRILEQKPGQKGQESLRVEMPKDFVISR